MKAKHYPHVTAAAAFLLLIAPAMVLLIPSHQAEDLDSLIAEAEQPASITPSTESKEQEPQITRVALAENGRTTPPLVSEKSATAPEPTGRSRQEPSIESNPAAVVVARVPVTEPTQPSEAPPEPVEDIDFSAAPDSPSLEERVAEEERNAVLAEEMEAALAMGSSTSRSHFESTGHLAMSAEPNRRPTRVARKKSSAEPDESEDDKETDVNADTMTPGGTMLLADDSDDPFASEPRNPIVDVVVQQPLERRPVSKVENLIAVTQQPGWPIALVRSDIPDDVWWVQQMVGIRHRSFASRVNFGNDTSLPGSVYHMVIVFLDSADEARRFRIAKQFKDIPEGLRRTREYTFVRK